MYRHIPGAAVTTTVVRRRRMSKYTVRRLVVLAVIIGLAIQFGPGMVFGFVMTYFLFKYVRLTRRGVRIRRVSKKSTTTPRVDSAHPYDNV